MTDDQESSTDSSELSPTVLEWVVDNIPVPTLITSGPALDDDQFGINEIMYVNEAWTRMTGYDAEEVIGDTPGILQGPKTEQQVLDLLEERLEAGKDFVGETINYRKNDEEYRVRWHVDSIRNEVGEVTHWVSIQEETTNDPLSIGFGGNQ